MINSRSSLVNTSYKWLHDSLNNPFKITLTRLKDVYMTAENIQKKFNALLNSHGNNQLSCLRERAKDNKNILHLLFGWQINKELLNHLEQVTKIGSDANEGNHFAQTKRHHIFLLDDLNERIHNKHKDKKHLTADEYYAIFKLSMRNAFYFTSLENYYMAQLTAIIKYVFDILNKHPEILTSMLIERDDAGLTPLHYLASHNSLANIQIYTATMKVIRALPADNKKRILFAEGVKNRLFLHEFCKNFALRFTILADAFNEKMLMDAFVYPDTIGTTPLHLACLHQDSNALKSIFTALHQHLLLSALLIQDSTFTFALIFLTQNTKLSNNDINDVFTDIDSTILNQALQLQTNSGDTLLTHAIKFNRDSIIKAIQRDAQPSILLATLTEANKARLYPISVAYREGTLDIFRLIIQLYSPCKAALYAVICIMPLFGKPGHFSSADAKNCLKEFMGTRSLDIFKLANILPNLINPTNPADNSECIKEFVDTVVCIAQSKALPPPPENFTFFSFTRKSSVHLSTALRNVTAEHVQWCFTEVLPLIKTYVRADKQKYVDMLLNQYNMKMGNTIADELSLTLLNTASLFVNELQPIYDGELEARWKLCIGREKDVAERERAAKEKIANLALWQKKLGQRESATPEMITISSFTLTNTLTKTFHAPQPSHTVCDALENRRLECQARELAVLEREKAITLRETKLAQWEAQLTCCNQDNIANTIQAKFS